MELAAVPAPDARQDRPRLAIADVSPLRRRGIADILGEHGFKVDVALSPDDDGLSSWARGDGKRGMVVAVDDDCQVVLLRALRCAHKDLALVALVPDESTEAHHRALRAGANTAVGHDAEPGRLVEAIALALDGCTVMPTEVAREIAAGPAEPATIELNDRERVWLQALADGRTVAEIADEAAYSHREMHRTLRALYKRLGAANRAQALTSATRQGLIG
jgi:DNA-binding NarL/FixJ family response regulator